MGRWSYMRRFHQRSWLTDVVAGAVPTGLVVARGASAGPSSAVAADMSAASGGKDRTAPSSCPALAITSASGQGSRT